MPLFQKADDTDWRALYLEERAKVDRLTQQMLRMKKQGYAPAPEPRPKPEPGTMDAAGVVLPSDIRPAIDRVAQQVKEANPSVTDEGARAEAVRLLSQFAGT